MSVKTVAASSAPVATHRAHSKEAADTAPKDTVATTAPEARVDKLIADVQHGRIKYAAEIAAGIRKQPLTLKSFPCHKYILDAKPQDAAEIPTEIVPKGKDSRYKDAVTIDSKLTKKETAKDLDARVDSIREHADELNAQHTESLMVLMEGDNADGKDGMVKHVFQLSPLTTSGTHAFKAADAEEKKHGPNWRIMQHTAGPGQIGFHNRTAYGDIVFACKTEADKAQRAADIKEMEYGLTMGLPMTPDGHIALPDAKGHVAADAEQQAPMRFLKVVLSVSEPEQAARLADRLLDDDKLYKISPADLKGHPDHRQVQTDFANAMARNSTPWAPTYYIPNDNKDTGWRKMAQITDEILKDMDPHPPSADQSMSRSARVAAARPLQAEAQHALTHKHE